MFEVINPQTGETGPHRISSEIDMSMSDFIHLIELSDDIPNSDIEYIQKLVHIARKYYMPDSKDDELMSDDLDFYSEHINDAHKPFDEQLENAKFAKSSLKKKDLLAPLSDTQKEFYKIKLAHLKRNLELIKNDRLHNYILQSEIGKIAKKLSDLEHFKIDIESDTYSQTEKGINFTKTISKANSFVATYFMLKINDLALVELQARTEFRDNLAKEGSSAHNSALQGKDFNIFHFFTLVNPPTNNEKINQEQFETFCQFLHLVSHNQVKNGIGRAKSERQYKAKLLSLVDFAQKKLKLKDDFTREFYNLSDETPATYQQSMAKAYGDNQQALINQKTQKSKVPLRKYIERIIEYYCAKYRNIQANHSEGDHNTIQLKNKTDKDVLLDFFKNRIGLSVLAYMIIDEYTINNSKTTRSYYETLSSYKEASAKMKAAMNEASKTIPPLEDKDGNPIYFPEDFHPMGDLYRSRD